MHGCHHHWRRMGFTNWMSTRIFGVTMTLRSLLNCHCGWQTHRSRTASVATPPDTTEWVGSSCPPLLEDFASRSVECPSTQESTSLVSGRVVNGDDSASSDDDDGGSVELDREEDAESLLCELESDDNGSEYD